MKIRIKKADHNAAWYMREYFVGRTCEVLAIQTRRIGPGRGTYKSYFVLHPVTKKTGYWVTDKHCEVVEKSKVPTWTQFLSNNDYGYKRYRPRF